MKRSIASSRDRIVLDPEIMTGKPVVKGTRIPVEKVLGFLADKPDIDELIRAYPRLTIEDVQACLAFGEDSVRQSKRRKTAPASKESSTAVA